MSERAPNSHESGNLAEVDPQQIKEISEKNQERLRAAAEKASAESNKDSIKEIQERIEKAAKSKDQMEASQADTAASEKPLHVGAGAQLKRQSYKRQVKSVQRQETASERAFSKIIHNPTVEAISDAAEGTVARPSGLLFAGIFAAISGLVVLYICKHYGYEYNFMISLAGLGGGFVAGLLFEGAYRIFKPSAK